MDVVPTKFQRSVGAWSRSRSIHHVAVGKYGAAIGHEIQRLCSKSQADDSSVGAQQDGDSRCAQSVRDVLCGTDTARRCVGGGLRCARPYVWRDSRACHPGRQALDQLTSGQVHVGTAMAARVSPK